MKKITLVVLCIGISACVSGYNPSYSYNQIQVANLSGAAIRDLQVNTASDRNLRCATVAKNSICDVRFGKRLYRQQDLELKWIGADGSQKSQRLTPHVAAFYHAGLPLQLMLEINADDSVSLHFEQESRGERFLN